MASYASLTQLKAYFTQIRDGANPPDADLQAVLDRAAALINLELGITTNLAAAASAPQVVYGDGTSWLRPPLHVAGSITAVTAPTGYSVPLYAQSGGRLIVKDSSGLLAPSGSYIAGFGWATPSIWTRGIPYTVTASYGASADVMTALTEANLEMAVALWNFKDAGGFRAVGNDQAVQIVRDAYAPVVKRVLDLIDQQRNGVGGFLA